MIKRFFMLILGICPQHGGLFNYPRKYRRNTAYVEDEGNWGYGCRQCQREDFDMMQELWDDFYSSRF